MSVVRVLGFQIKFRHNLRELSKLFGLRIKFKEDEVSLLNKLTLVLLQRHIFQGFAYIAQLLDKFDDVSFLLQPVERGLKLLLPSVFLAANTAAGNSVQNIVGSVPKHSRFVHDLFCGFFCTTTWEFKQLRNHLAVKIVIIEGAEKE